MTFEEAKAFKQTLNENYESALKIFKEEFDQFKSAMGLIPDHIRETPRYQEVYKELNRTMDACKTFGKWYVKQFKKEIQKEQRELVKSRYKRAN
jgi:hypothetical protein